MFPIRSYVEITRGLPACFLLFYRDKSTQFGMNPEHGNAVMSTVGTIEEFPGRMNPNLRSGIIALVAGWKGGDGLNVSQTSFSIIAKSISSWSAKGTLSMSVTFPSCLSIKT